jgi:hypothetical protein
MAIYGGQVQTTPYQAPDYGPSVAAARELAMTGAQGIAGAVGQVADYFKNQKESKNSALMGLKIAEAAKIMDPAQAPYYDNIINTLKDENTPVDVRGALGAQVQDLLKQNTSMRAVAVQERQMGMMPSFMSGGRPIPTRSYNATAIQNAAAQPALLGDNTDLSATQQNQENRNLYEGAAEGAPVNILLNNVNELLGKGAEVGAFTPEENESIRKTAGSAAVAWNEAALKDVIQDLNKRYTKAQQKLEVSKDETPVEMQTPEKVRRIVKTQGGLLKDVDTGEIVDRTTGKSTRIGGNVSYITQEYIDKLNQEYENQFNQDNPLLNPIDGRPDPNRLPDNFDPQSSIGTPEERARVRALQQEGQDRAIVQNVPQGAMPTEQSMAYGATQPAPQQKSAGIGWMAKESQQAAKSKTIQNTAQEYESLTTLNPYQQEIVNEAMIEASQSGMAPGSELANELERNILYNRAFVPTSLPKKGVRIVTPEDKKRQSVALVSQARQRVSDRVAAEELMSRFDNIQAILNHPDAAEFFGQSIPSEKLNEIAKSQGGIYALYKNLKGQDLVQAMQNIKQRSGTAAQMSERETFALQAAVNEFDSAQDLKSAQKSLKEMAAATIRAGKKMGLDEMVFDYAMDDKGNKTKEFNTTKILNSYDEFTPIFKDELEYSKKIERLKPMVEGQQPTTTAPQAQPQSGQTQQATPSFDPYGQAYKNLQQQDQRFFPK